MGAFEDVVPFYLEQAELLAPHVDILLCETMSSAAEGRAAAWAACQTGMPVWVAWTLHEDRSGHLRSGEQLADAITALQDLPVTGYLLNCCAPESVTMALPYLTSTTARYIGAYANTFEPVPEDWQLDGTGATHGLLDLRSDLSPENYAAHVTQWLRDGATVVGGCCGTRPAHIARLHGLRAQ